MEPDPAWAGEWWYTPELQGQIAQAHARQGAHRDERSLLEGEVLARRHVAEGTNTTHRVELDNGVVGYHKPFDGADEELAEGFGHTSSQQSVHEVAAWQLAREMGPPWSELVPPVVLREISGSMGSFALERPGKNLNWQMHHVPEWREAAFFDTLIGQQDRHAGNYLLSGDRMYLIDHGYTFARPNDYLNWSYLRSERISAPGGVALTHTERIVLDRLLASPDLLGAAPLLEPERAAALRSRAERMREAGTLVEEF